jgi:hypothetical protein
MTESFEAREKRIAQMENRLMALKSQQKENARKRETKRLILEGRLLEHLIEWGVVPQEVVTEKLDGWLTRDYDRSLFDLPPKNKDEPASPPAKTKGQKQPKAAREITIKPPAVPETPPDISPAYALKETGVSEDEFMIH